MAPCHLLSPHASFQYRRGLFDDWSIMHITSWKQALNCNFTSSFHGAVSSQLSTVIFKKKQVVIQSNGDGNFERFETVKWLAGIVCPTEN